MKIKIEQYLKLGVLFIGAFAAEQNSIAAEQKGYPFEEHIDQFTINQQSIQDVYQWGKALFEAPYNHLDGSGRNFRDDPTDMIRMPYSRIPRPDLPGFLTDPIRMSGPGARNCRECHNSFNGNIQNSLFDFRRSGNIAEFAERQTPHVAGGGAIQLLAEQTSKELWTIRDNAIAEAAESHETVTVEMISSNGVSFGTLIAFPDGSLDVSGVQGVENQDNFFLLTKQFQVAPFYSKAEVGFLRIMSSTSPTGMQSPEMYPSHIDGDNDGVVGEFSTGDTTAITVYSASQPRPVTKLELHQNMGGKFRLSRQEIRSIKRGEQVFEEVGCASCHTPKAEIRDATFNEPTQTVGYSFPYFWNKYFNADGTPGRTDPREFGYDPADPFSFSLKDLPSIPCERTPKIANGWKDVDNMHKYRHRHWGNRNYRKRQRTCWREFEIAESGGIVIYPYTDFKRYDLGEGLGDAVPSFGGVAPTVWKTKGLWGTGSTGPWLHDGRATTLFEAIRWHKGDADQVRANFFSASEDDQDDMINFLENLVIYNSKENAIQSSGMGFPAD